MENSYSFKEGLSNTTIEEEEVLVARDMPNLFTCICQALAINAVRKVVMDDNEINRGPKVEKKEII